MDPAKGLPLRRAADRSSVAERQMAMKRARPWVLPDGADPELAALIGEGEQ